MNWCFFYSTFKIQRGVGRGQWGDRITGTTIKDTWTKSRGRVEVGEKLLFFKNLAEIDKFN